MIGSAKAPLASMTALFKCIIGDQKTDINDPKQGTRWCIGTQTMQFNFFVMNMRYLMTWEAAIPLTSNRIQMIRGHQYEHKARPRQKQ